MCGTRPCRVKRDAGVKASHRGAGTACVRRGKSPSAQKAAGIQGDRPRAKTMCSGPPHGVASDCDWMVQIRPHHPAGPQRSRAIGRHRSSWIYQNHSLRPGARKNRPKIALRGSLHCNQPVRHAGPHGPCAPIPDPAAEPGQPRPGRTRRVPAAPPDHPGTAYPSLRPGMP